MGSCHQKNPDAVYTTGGEVFGHRPDLLEYAPTCIVSRPTLCSVDMQTLWLARHANRQDLADPDWASTADRPHDPGLAPDGVRQARELGERVDRMNVDRIVSSPFLRAVETACSVAEVVGMPVYLEPGLGEWLNAEWFESAPQILPSSLLTERFSRIRPDHTPCHTPIFPETKDESLTRIGATVRCLTERYPDETLLLVGHGATVEGILHELVGPDVPMAGCDLASLTEVVRTNSRWSIRTRNDTSHLQNGDRPADR